MGVSNATCAVSFLPILGEEPCRFIFLRETQYGPPSYHGDLWKPATLPVKGIYDEYGSVRQVETTPLVRFQAEVFQRFGRTPGLASDMRKSWLRRKGWPENIGGWCALCERDELRLTVDFGSVVGIKTLKTVPFIVREEVYQALIQPPGEGIGTSRPNVVSYVGHAVSSIEMAINHAKERQERPSPEEMEGMSPEIQDALQRGWDLLDKNPLAFRRELEFLVCGAYQVDPEIFPALFDFTQDDWGQLDREVIDFLTFCANLRECRREFMPALYRDQTYGPDNPTVANEALCSLIANKWGPELRARLDKDAEE